MYCSNHIVSIDSIAVGFPSLDLSVLVRHSSAIQAATEKRVLVVVHLRDSVSSAGNGLVATLAVPDTNSLALDGFLSAKGADVAGVLLDFHLLHLLTQGGTVSVVEHIVSTNHFSGFSFFFILLSIHNSTSFTRTKEIVSHRLPTSNRIIRVERERGAQEPTWYHIYP